MAAAATAPAAASDAPQRNWLAIPAPVRRLFNLFPLAVYQAEALPCGAPDRVRPRPVLHVFADVTSPSTDAPSFNPSCLKWQAVLRIAGVQVDVVPSNNHASPSGALPFLLAPTTTTTTTTSKPLTGDAILQYAQSNASRTLQVDEPFSSASLRLDAYRSLMAQSIRPAWLYALYLNPANQPLLYKLYLSSSPLLSYPLSQQLRTAATAEILSTTRRPSISPQQLLDDADSALEALSALLGDARWFSASAPVAAASAQQTPDSPGVFDADVFSYTWLVLGRDDDNNNNSSSSSSSSNNNEKPSSSSSIPAADLVWQDKSLATILTKYDNLVAHRERMYRYCWADTP